MYCYDKILINVAAYVIPGWVCIVRSKTTITFGNMTCKLPEDGVLTPKQVGII